MRPTHLIAPLVLALAGIGWSAAGLADLSEDQAKTSLIFNMTKFVQWPATTEKNLDVCVYRDDPITPTLSTLGGRTSKGQTLRVQRVDTTEQARACQVLFIGRGERGNLRPLVQALRGLPILVISDIPDSAAAGAMVEAFLSDRRIAFKVNKAMTDEAKLKLSSQLLSLAKALYENN